MGLPRGVYVFSGLHFGDWQSHERELECVSAAFSLIKGPNLEFQRDTSCFELIEMLCQQHANGHNSNEESGLQAFRPLHV